MERVKKNSREKISFGLFIQSVSDAVCKGAILLVLLVASLILILFMPFVIKKEIIFEMPLTGLTILNILSFGGEYGYNFSGTVYMFQLPGIVPVVYLISLIFILISVGMVVWFNFIRRQDKKWIGYMFFVMALYFAAVFMVFISLETPQTDIYGETVPMRQSYNPSSCLLILTLIYAFSGLMQVTMKLARLRRIKRFWFIYLMLIPGLLYIAVFEIYPLFLQIVMAFKDYKLATGVWGSEWIGLGNLEQIFSDRNIYGAILNTFYLSFLFMLTGIFPSLIFALMLFEMKSDRTRKVVQTISYLPHFFSWVIIYAIVYAFLGTQGIVNSVLEKLGLGSVNFLMSKGWFIPILLITDIWKGMGWGTIIFLAALSGVDPSLYDAAAVDGAGPIRKLFNITLPSIAPVFMFILIMNIGNLLKGANGEQLLMFASSVTKRDATTIGTWLYWEGLKKTQFGLGAAMSFFQSVVGLIMVLGANQLSKKLIGRSII